MKKTNLLLLMTMTALLIFFSCSIPGIQEKNNDYLTEIEQTINSATIGNWPVLKIGTNGIEVYTLQYLLNANGITCAVDGDFGSETESAVKSFQSKKGLEQDGIVGQNTWIKLFITVKNGSTGNAVKALQYQLKNRHGYSLAIDGDFGSATESAVRNFQEKCGLMEDAIAGPATWQYIICGTTQTFTYNNIKKVMQTKGYAFFTGNYNVNLIAVRSANRTANQWDDWFFMLYQENGVNKIMSFDDFTTDPGLYYLQHPINSDGCAIVVPGQYRGVWQIGIHNGSYEALVQTGGNIKVYRDKNYNNILDMKDSTIQTGMFGINLHHGSGDAVIGNHSAGCQVFKYSSDLTKVLTICKEARKNYGNSFTYTLLNISDF